MPHFIRVEDKATGAQYDVDVAAFDDALHKRVSAPTAWPDLIGDRVEARPAAYPTKAGKPAPDKKEIS